MPQFFITSKSNAKAVFKRERITHALSILDPDSRVLLISTSREVVHKTIHCEDAFTESEPNPPTQFHVEEILKFGKSLPEDAKVLVHCFAGVSRSTAACLLLLAQDQQKKNVSVDFELLREQLFNIRPEAVPNPIISRIGDQLLGFNGKLFELSEEIANSRCAFLRDN